MNHVKIGDFGISKILSSKSKAMSVVGTPSYISPELCEGKPYNAKGPRPPITDVHKICLIFDPLFHLAFDPYYACFLDQALYPSVVRTDVLYGCSPRATCGPWAASCTRCAP